MLEIRKFVFIYRLRLPLIVTFRMAVQSLLVDSGYTKVLHMVNKLEAITTLCVHSVILSRKGAIDQFAIGLKPLLELLKENPEFMKQIFVETFKELLIFEEVQTKMKKVAM